MMRNLGRLLGLLCFLMSISDAYSKNIGTYGELFEVQEEDIRTLIMRRLKEMESNGTLEKEQRAIEKRVINHVTRPKPLMLTRATNPKTFKVNPSIVVARDIVMPNGVVIAKAGSTINPFEHLHYSKTLFFFNADDKKQVLWAKKNYTHYKNVKFILTGGDVQKESLLFGRVYFDVGGVLSEKLHITHVPSVVNQEGLVWRIQEIGVNDE